MAKLIDKSIPRFLLVGVGNTLLSMVLMFLLEGLGYWPSTAIAYVAGAVMSFFLNRHFTFQSEETLLRSAVKFAVNVAVCYVVAYALAQPIARLFYGEGQSTPIVARSLALLGIASLASSLCGPFSSMLQAVGKAGWNVRLLVAAMALKLAANWFLCAIPEMNIQGAALGTLASYLFLAAAQLGCLRRATGVRLSWLGSFLRPLACALLCGMGARLAYGALGPLLPSGRWGDGAALLAAMAFGAGLYLVALLLLRGIRKSDLQSLPKGQKIAKTLEKQGWI